MDVCLRASLSCVFFVANVAPFEWSIAPYVVFELLLIQWMRVNTWCLNCYLMPSCWQVLGSDGSVLGTIYGSGKLVYDELLVRLDTWIPSRTHKFELLLVRWINQESHRAQTVRDPTVTLWMKSNCCVQSWRTSCTHELVHFWLPNQISALAGLNY